MRLYPYSWRRKLRKVPYLRDTYRWLRDCWHYFCFVLFADVPLSYGERIALLKRLRKATKGIDCAHTEGELLVVMAGMLALTPDVPGVVVEAGCFKGGSSAKFSVICKRLGRKLIVYDSFEGMPENDDPHDQPSKFGFTSHYPGGIYAGAYQEVVDNVRNYGEPEVCSYVKGWFDDTMPGFDQPIAAIYLDVDLPSSTRTCLKHLYPRLSPGGLLYSQDAHLPPVVDVFEDEQFWRRELGIAKPQIIYSRHKGILWVRKAPN